MEDMTVYRNFRIYNGGNSFIVRADSKRFGQNAVVYEDYDVKKCVNWIYAHYRNNSGKIITNAKHTTAIYVQAMKTCRLENNIWFKEEIL